MAAIYWPEIPYLFFPTILLFYYAFELLTTRNPSKKTPPLVGKTSIFLSRSILNLIYAVKGAGVVGQGYKKFRGKAFQFIRGDGNVIVLPIEMADEFGSLPSTIATSHAGLEHELLAPYTGFGVLSQTRLHRNVVQRKLTPRIKDLTPHLEEEIQATFEDIFPNCNEWTEIMPYKLFAKVSARLTGRALVGPDLCRNPTWIESSIYYTENVFKTAAILRLLPTWTHPFIGPLLLPYWQCWRYIRSAISVLSPKAVELLQRSDGKSWSSDASKDNYTLAWAANSARGPDRDPQLLANLQLVLAFAGVHTTLIRMVSVLYDLIAHPSYISELRDEISNVCQAGWDENSYNKLQKLDSVIRESQRMNPPGVTSMRRLFSVPHTFSNGVHIPKGTYVCLPVFQIENDPAYVKNPDAFDGLRSYRLRQREGEEQQHQFTSADKTNLGFGYGKEACPGRFFASLIIKVLFVKLLTEYEFAFLPGKGRPKNIYLHEFVFPWPWERVLVRKRQKSTCPF